MKLILSVFLISFAAVSALAQHDTAEKNFVRDLPKLKLEKYTMGEDATSGYDYLIYKKGKAIVKIRTVWSSSANPGWWAEDCYFNAGTTVLVVKYTLKKSQFKTTIRGSQTALPVTDKFYLKDSKLVRWIENGKEVPSSDSRWREIETEAVATGKDALEMYPELKRN